MKRLKKIIRLMKPADKEFLRRNLELADCEIPDEILYDEPPKSHRQVKIERRLAQRQKFLDIYDQASTDPKKYPELLEHMRSMKTRDFFKTGVEDINRRFED